MILEPWKSADEIERRLRDLEDPELARLIRAANRDLYDEVPAPFWKRRIGLLTLAGLFALAAGYSSSVTLSHQRHATAPLAAGTASAGRIARAAPAKPKHQAAAAAPAHHTAPVKHAAAVTPAEILIRQARSQLAQERAVAAQAQAAAALAQHQAQAAVQAQRTAQAQAHANAVAQARAEAFAQAQAEEVARQQSQAVARAQARAEAVARAQSQAFAQAQEEELAAQRSQMSIKPGDGGPPSTDRVGTYPGQNGVPVPPVPPIDRTCTPNRGTILTRALDNVRIGGTSVGGLLRIIH